MATFIFIYFSTNPAENFTNFLSYCLFLYMRVILAFTGASGVIYGVRLLEELKKKGIETYLIISKNASRIIEYETSYKATELEDMAEECFDEEDMHSKLASGSFSYDAMIVCPCSLKTLSCIANGIALNLIVRTAICCLKEGRKLIVVPRESPLDLISLENMVKLKKAGAIILPAMPAFYFKPKSIDDLVGYVVGKIMEQIGIEHNLYEKWSGE